MNKKPDSTMISIGAIVALISLITAYYMVKIQHVRVSNFLFGGMFNEAESFQFIFAIGFAAGVPLVLFIGAPLACFIEDRMKARENPAG